MLNVPEFSCKSMTVGGIHIPRNKMVMLDVVSLNHNQDAWQSEALTFRPASMFSSISCQKFASTFTCSSVN
jgi:cytochrome P450